MNDNTPDMTDLPEGVYVDKDAIAKEIDRTMQVILNDVVTNLNEQTLLVASIDKSYEAAGVPDFIREQAAQRLGDILADLTVLPITDRLTDIYKDTPHK